MHLALAIPSAASCSSSGTVVRAPAKRAELVHSQQKMVCVETTRARVVAAQNVRSVAVPDSGASVDQRTAPYYMRASPSVTEW